MNPYETVLRDRIAVLIGYRRWYRRFIVGAKRQALWKPLDDEYRDELRALLKLARLARKMEAARPDPLSLAKAAGDQWAGWTPGELQEAFGR